MIPSLLQIPSAVSDSKLHSVLPNNGKGDFTFDRSTGATRINKDGLIEEVGYFSSELVQNGDFSELGSELVTNGNFDNWTNNNPDGWTVVNEDANNFVSQQGTYARIVSNDTASIQIRQTIFTIGKTYKVELDAVVNDGNVEGLKLNDATAAATIGYVNSTGHHTFYFVAAGTAFVINRKGGGATDISIDNVSVKQVDPNDRWTLGTGWSLGDGVANCDGSQSANSLFFQNIGVLANKTVRFNFTVSNYSAGQLSTSFFGASGTTTHNVTANGEYSFVIDVQSGHNGNSGFTANSSFIGSVDNVSIKEVQGDRPRLSYDITNGVVEDKPHLLLEPSSTNLIKFSNDYTQSEWNKISGATVDANVIISPDGTLNASRLNFNTVVGSRMEDQIPSASSGDYSFAVYLKADEPKTVGIRTGFAGTPTVNVNVTTEWQRFSITQNNPTNPANGYAQIRSIDASGGSVYVWGAQIEQQSYSTSFIPTAGTTITRAAETCNNSKPSVNSTEGVLYGEINIPENIADNVNVAISDGTNTEYVKFIYLPSTSTFKAEIQGNSNTKAINDTSFVLGSYSKIAILYKSGEFKLYVNGSQIGNTLTGHTLPTGLDTVSFDRGNAAAFFYGKVKGLAVYNEALSESQLMQLTGVTASSIYSNFVTRTASFTVEALNEVKKVIDNL